MTQYTAGTQHVLVLVFLYGSQGAFGKDKAT